MLVCVTTHCPPSQSPAPGGAWARAGMDGRGSKFSHHDRPGMQDPWMTLYIHCIKSHSQTAHQPQSPHSHRSVHRLAQPTSTAGASQPTSWKLRSIYPFYSSSSRHSEGPWLQNASSRCPTSTQMWWSTAVACLGVLSWLATKSAFQFAGRWCGWTRLGCSNMCVETGFMPSPTAGSWCVGESARKGIGRRLPGRRRCSTFWMAWHGFCQASRCVIFAKHHGVSFLPSITVCWLGGGLCSSYSPACFGSLSWIFANIDPATPTTCVPGSPCAWCVGGPASWALACQTGGGAARGPPSSGAQLWARWLWAHPALGVCGGGC